MRLFASSPPATLPLTAKPPTHIHCRLWWPYWLATRALLSASLGYRAPGLTEAPLAQSLRTICLVRVSHPRDSRDIIRHRPLKHKIVVQSTLPTLPPTHPTSSSRCCLLPPFRGVFSFDSALFNRSSRFKAYSLMCIPPPYIPEYVRASGVPRLDRPPEPY